MRVDQPGHENPPIAINGCFAGIFFRKFRGFAEIGNLFFAGKECAVRNDMPLRVDRDQCGIFK